MKPDWKDAPEWAKYLCRDIANLYWWNEEKPELIDGFWTISGKLKCQFAGPADDLKQRRFPMIEERP